jgi:LysR family transcriptional regulator, transcription activator of glutamate synthase operon
VEIAQLRWFVEVAEGRTVTAAAAALHVSQPALSRGLARLEHELGAPLFDRIGRGLRLNTNGQALLDAAKRALNALDTAAHAIGAASDPTTGTVRLAFLQTIGTEFVPALLSGFRTRYPKVEFVLRQGGSENNLRQLLDGDIDVVLTAGPLDYAGVEWQPLVDEPLVVVVPTGHRLARRKRVALAEISDEPFVAFAHTRGLRAITDKLCQEAGFTPRVVFEGEDPTMLRGLVGARCGVALVAPAPGPTPGIVELPVSVPRCHRTIGIAWYPEHYAPAVVRTFREYVLTESRPPATWASFTV